MSDDAGDGHVQCPGNVAAWLRSLTSKQRRIAKTLATGESTAAAAKKHRVSAGRVSQMRRELQDAWFAFQGEWAVA